jgi:hypothetical protein
MINLAAQQPFFLYRSCFPEKSLKSFVFPFQLSILTSAAKSLGSGAYVRRKKEEGEKMKKEEDLSPNEK